MPEPVLRDYLFPHSCITVTTKVNNTAIFASLMKLWRFKRVKFDRVVSRRSKI